MSSLIITIISVLLVGVLALVAMLYTGSAADQAGARADAAKYLNQGQQLLGAADLYKSDTGAWPQSIEQLRTGKYLTAELTGDNNKKWTMPEAGNPTFVLTDVAKDSCKQVNNLAFRVEGVFNQLSSAYAAQCFSPETTAYRVVVTKGAAHLTQTGACPAGTSAQGIPGLGQVLCKPLPVDDCDSADWRVKPKTCGVPPGEPPVTPPPPSNGARFNPSSLSYVFDKGQSSMSTIVTLENNGTGSFGPSDITVNDPNSSFYVMPDCNTTLQPGDSCAIEVMAYGNTGGKYVADITVAKNGSVLGKLPLLINTGNVVLANKGSSSKLDEIRLPSTMTNVPTSKVFSAVNRGTAPASMPVFYGNQASIVPSVGCPATLAPGASCDVTVTGTASWEGTVWDNVYSYTSFNGFESYSVVFDNLPSELVLSTTYLDFGNVAVQRTKTLSVLVSNSSSNPANLTVPDSIGAFTVEHNCPASLGASGTPTDTCTLSLTFSPTAEQGYGETLTLQTSLGAASLTVTGQGVAEKPFLEFIEVASENPPYLSYYEELGVSPARIVNETVRLKNKGFGDAEITFAKAEESSTGTSQGSNAFTFTHNCPAKLAEGASCTINLAISLAPYAPYRTPQLLASYPNSAYGNPAQLNINLFPTYTANPSLKPAFGGEEIKGVERVRTVYALTNTTNSNLTISAGALSTTNIPTNLAGVGLLRTISTIPAIDSVPGCLEGQTLQPGQSCLVRVTTSLDDPSNLAENIPFLDTSGIMIPTSKGNARRDTVLEITSIRAAVTGMVSSMGDSGSFEVSSGNWRREWTFTLRALNNGLDPYVYVETIGGFLPTKDNYCQRWVGQNQYCDVTYVYSIEGTAPIPAKSTAELVAHGAPASYTFVGGLKTSQNNVISIPDQVFSPHPTPTSTISLRFNP